MPKQASNQPYGIEGRFARKTDVEEYVGRVKEKNPNGVVVCIDTEEGTHEKIKTDGAFNVYMQLYDKVFVDYLGKGFDMGAITKGKEIHESWVIDWKDVLFLKPSNINEQRTFLISQDDYLESARRRLAHLLNIGYEPEEIKGKIPKTYTPMSLTIKDMLINDVIVPLYFQKNKLKVAGLNSFGVQGMIINKERFPIEVNREARFSKKGFYDKKDETER